VTSAPPTKTEREGNLEKELHVPLIMMLLVLLFISPYTQTQHHNDSLVKLEYLEEDGQLWGITTHFKPGYRIIQLKLEWSSSPDPFSSFGPAKAFLKIV
jgi:hypothetical protein